MTERQLGLPIEGMSTDEERLRRVTGILNTVGNIISTSQSDTEELDEFESIFYYIPPEETSYASALPIRYVSDASLVKYVTIGDFAYPAEREGYLKPGCYIHIDGADHTFVIEGAEAKLVSHVPSWSRKANFEDLAFYEEVIREIAVSEEIVFGDDVLLSFPSQGQKGEQIIPMDSEGKVIVGAFEHQLRLDID